MAGFMDDSNNVLMIRNDIKKTVLTIYALKSNRNSVNSISQKFEDATNMEIPPHLSSTQINTYYTPSRHDAIRCKASLFVEIPDSIIDVTDIDDIDTSILGSEEGGEQKEEQDRFRRQGNRSWLHVATGVHMSCNPFE